MSDMTITNFPGELNIPLYLDNGSTLSIMPKHYYYNHDILHICEKMPVDDISIYPSKSDKEHTLEYFLAYLFNKLQYSCNY